MNKKVIITGATGMVGSLVLQECLNSDEISEIVSISRKSAEIKHEKLTEIIHEDFTDYSTISDAFENIDVAYFCIGVYTGAVSREKFRKITVDYTVAFANALKAQSPDAAFCFLSGAGADRSEKSRMMFAKDKGIAENFLFRQNFKKLFVFRPAYIYPVTPRIEPNFSYVLSRKLYPMLKKIMPGSVITSEQLARAMFKTGLNGTGQVTYENPEIKKL